MKHTHHVILCRFMQHVLYCYDKYLYIPIAKAFAAIVASS